MDFTSPLTTISTSLDGAVLQALAGTTTDATITDIRRVLPRGSDEGVRKVLVRLIEQGVVHAQDHGRLRVYRLNREHLAAPYIEGLATLRRSFIDNLVGAINGWRLQPVHASLFGSVARGDARLDSDIDLLLVHPDGDDSMWSTQVSGLERAVEAWTGNGLQVVDPTLRTLQDMAHAADPLVASLRSDSLHLAGRPLHDILRRGAA